MMGQNVAGRNVAGQGFMAGAVAINGGVGVMELRRPQVNMDLLPSVDDVVNSVAAVAAEIAENAHITLRELKAKIDAVTEKKLPQYKQLMEQNPVAVAQTSVNGATITAYQNGYAVYEADGAHSVMDYFQILDDGYATWGFDTTLLDKALSDSIGAKASRQYLKTYAGE